MIHIHTLPSAKRRAWEWEGGSVGSKGKERKKSEAARGEAERYKDNKNIKWRSFTRLRTRGKFPFPFLASVVSWEDVNTAMSLTTDSIYSRHPLLCCLRGWTCTSGRGVRVSMEKVEFVLKDRRKEPMTPLTRNGGIEKKEEYIGVSIHHQLKLI